ncbi:acyltransferase [Dyadobacter sp. CY326]|uniref:acyltransferase family protein n=1 Tax=Dyadobacter sp. CY326 TaxID=2907300 RepID=UPI001F16381A|nr:acyltransferase [Dyadobacter sp. CY326]MCE7066588.1 acyltransferase [Dyadobacter sp. CY326]
MKLHSIQFLRALAALLVVYCHSLDLQVKYAVSHQQGFHFLQDFGAIGVDIFFVISGFIISFIGHDINGRRNTYQFLKKRFIRINPYYYLVSIVAFGFLLQREHGAFSFKAILKTLTILPIEPGSQIWWPILTIGWTLSFEWFFYMLFAVLIYKRIQHKEFYLTAMLIALVGLGQLMPSNQVIINFITHPIILEFGVGALMGWVLRNKKISSNLAAASLVTSLVCFVLLITFGYGRVSEMDEVLSGRVTFARLFYFGIPSILLVFGCVFLETNAKLKGLWGNRQMLLLGDASYSIYLVHTIVFSALGLVYDNIGMAGAADLIVMVQMVLATGIGVICHIAVEKKIVPVFTSLADNVELIFRKNYTYLKA